MKFMLLTVCALRILSAQEEPEVRFGTTVVMSSGFQGNVFHISQFTKKLPSLDKLDKKKPVGTIYTSYLNIPTQDFRAGFPGVTKKTEWFAIDYKAKFWIETPGRYRFILTSDDGSILTIDDEQVIDNDGQHPTVTKDGAIDLAAGLHKIRVTYFQGPGYEIALILAIEPPGQPARIFNTENFKPPVTVETLPPTIPK
jgi:hypothetical protein